MTDDLLKDFTWAIRRARGTPVFACVVVGTLALAIGANVTLLSALSAVSLRPLAIDEPGRLVLLTLVDPRNQTANIPLSTTAQLQRTLNGSFSSLSPYSTGGILATQINGSVQQATIEAVGPEYYPSLGVRPAVGRLIDQSDGIEPTSANPVVVLGYQFWQRAFDGAPSIIGKTLAVEGVPLQVIGVLPLKYSGITIELAPDIAVPIALLPRLLGMPVSPRVVTRSNFVIGMLRPEVTVEASAAEIAGRWPTLRAATVPAAYSPAEQDAYRHLNLHVATLKYGTSTLRTRYVDSLTVLVLLAFTLLVVAAVNIAGLFFVRAYGRAHDVAVAMALGASRRRLLRRAVVEGLMFASIGTTFALPLGWWGSTTLGAIIWTGVVPSTLSFSPDWRVLAVTGFLTLAMTSASALPVWLVSRRVRLVPGTSRSVTGSQNVSRGLVVAQVALSLVLLFVGLLCSRTLSNLRAIPMGFNGDNVLVGRLQGQPGASSMIDRASYSRELLERIDAQASVRTAALAHLFPAVTSEPPSVAVSGAADRAGVPAAFDQISPGFFATIGVHVLQGRDFDWSDAAASRAVAVITQRLASKLFQNANALGRHIRIGARPNETDVEVVGIVGDVRAGDPHKPGLPSVFRPLLQEPQAAPIPVLLVQTADAPERAVDGIRRAVASLGLEYAPNLLNLNTRLQQFFLQERILSGLGLLFAGLATLLGFLGLFALLAQSVARRQREIGIRMALGATPRNVMTSVLSNALIVTLAGITIGLPLAIVSGRWLKSLLFGVAPTDPISVVIAVGVFVLVSLIAGALPGWRATRVDPVQALRAD